MTRLLIVLLVIVLSACGKKESGSAETKSIETKPENQEVDLDKLEKISKAEKGKLMESLALMFPQTKANAFMSGDVKDFHFIDLDNDQDNDLIYTGWSGAEPDHVRILLNCNNQYKDVFAAFQRLKKIDFTNGQLSHLTILDPGCCASYMIFTEDYEITGGPDSLSFGLTDRVGIIYGTESPKERFSAPIGFEVSNELDFVRKSANADTVDLLYPDHRGNDNIIAEYGKGTKGRALGEEKDQAGGVWWFVEIDSTFKPIKSEFYDIGRTRVQGWMSPQNLKRL